jgi:prephenate dehydratase
MADALRKVDYYYVLLPDRVGIGAKVLGDLATHKVNLRAFSGFPNGRRVQLDLFPEDSKELVAAAKTLRLPLSKRERSFLLQGADRPGALTAILAKLAKAGISVTALDAVTAGKARFGAIFWVKPEDYTRTAKLLKAK